jgi:diguanylate cyclase (GGDEF)-like protein
MPLKEDFVRRLNLFTIISIIVFILAIGVYFYLSLQTQMNGIEASLNLIRGQSPESASNINSISNNLVELNILYLAEIITFYLAILALIFSLWYTTQKYLVQRKDALIDSLTQIYNRKAVFFSLKRELSKSERYGHPTTVAILDIDHFKKYNDSNGHVAGDRLLKRFAIILSNRLREYDVIGRYGGEEFLIVFPETPVEEAAKVCERIRSSVESTQFYGQDKMPFKKVTVSIGLSGVKGKKRIKEQTIIHKADEFLYQAKESGRNQVQYQTE